VVLVALALLLIGGCWRDDMADDGHIKPLESNTFFADGKSARPLINGTVPRGGKMISDPMYAVTATTQPEAKQIGIRIDKEALLRGQQQYAIFCTPCHGALGDGNGMIVQRGFPHPPAFYPVEEHKTSAQQPIRDLYPREVALAKAPPGHFYNVITHGYGAMYSYGDRIKEDDRWRIVAYVRALQLTANASATPTAAPTTPATPAPIPTTQRASAP
jgi:mono/diheme cytochrome c family protein